MHITILTNEYPPHVYGGAGVHVEYLTRELAAVGWERLDALEGMLGPDLRTVTADAIQIHALASEGRFAFERAQQEWPANMEARDGLQRLLEMLIRYELSNGNVRSAAGLLGSLPKPRPQLEREVKALSDAQLERRQEIARLEKLRYEGDINVFTKPRAALSLLHGLTLAVLVGGVTMVRRLVGGQPGYPDAIAVIAVLMVVVALGRRRTMTRYNTNEINRRLFDSILVTLALVVGSLGLGWWGAVPYFKGLPMAIFAASACVGIVSVFFDRRLLWMALAFAVVAVAVMAAPEYRGIWIAVGGFGAFAVGGIVWRDVDTAPVTPSGTAPHRRSSPPSSGSRK